MKIRNLRIATAEAGTTMQQIVGSVRDVSRMIGDITVAASEQSTGLGQVNASVAELDRMTQQNSALVEESTAAAQSLKEQAQRLAGIVAMFRIEGAPRLPAA